MASEPLDVPWSPAAWDGPWKVLLVANSRYAPSLGCLDGPRQDLEVVAAGLQRLCNLDGPPKVLHDATCRQMMEEFNKLWKPTAGTAGTASPPLCFVFFAGHGFHTSQGTFLAPVDADPTSLRTMISVEALRQQFSRKSGGMLVLVTACCREGIAVGALQQQLLTFVTSCCRERSLFSRYKNRALAAEATPCISRIERQPSSLGEVILYSCRPGSKVYDSGRPQKIHFNKPMESCSTLASSFFQALLLSSYLRLPLLGTLELVREMCIANSPAMTDEGFPELLNGLNRQGLANHVFLVSPCTLFRGVRKSNDTGYIPPYIFESTPTVDFPSFWQAAHQKNLVCPKAAELLSEAFGLYEVNNLNSLTGSMTRKLESSSSPYLEVLALGWFLPYTKNVDAREEGLRRLLQLLEHNEFDSYPMASGLCVTALCILKQSHQNKVTDAFHLLMRASELYRQSNLPRQSCFNQLSAWGSLLSWRQETGIQQSDAKQALKSLQELRPKCAIPGQVVQCDLLRLVAHNAAGLKSAKLKSDVLASFQSLRSTDTHAAERLKERLRHFPVCRSILEVQDRTVLQT